MSAILVILNTFGGAFLITFLYPLLVMSTTALYAVFPSLLPMRPEAKGEPRNEKVKRFSDNVEYQPVRVTKNNSLDPEQDHFDVARGELTLYENEDLFIGSVFRAGCQLLILQGIRVSGKFINLLLNLCALEALRNK